MAKYHNEEGVWHDVLAKCQNLLSCRRNRITILGWRKYFYIQIVTVLYSKSRKRLVVRFLVLLAMTTMLRRRIVVGILLLLFLVSTITAQEEVSTIVSEEFLNACTNGNIKLLQSLLVDHEHASWIRDGRSKQGETCLHVAGIYGQVEVTQYLLQHGSDPNVRSTYQGGLRMPPLAWNVYGGHVDAAKVLLQGGADVNLDFDDMSSPKQPVTVLDVCLQLVETDATRFEPLLQLLLEYGAKTYRQLMDASNKNKEL